MSSLRLLMARSRPSWLLWMTLGSLLLIPLVAIDFGLELAREAHAMWHWKWRSEVIDFLGYFGERHRLSLHSLGAKQLP